MRPLLLGAMDHFQRESRNVHVPVFLPNQERAGALRLLKVGLGQAAFITA